MTRRWSWKLDKKISALFEEMVEEKKSNDLSTIWQENDDRQIHDEENKLKVRRSERKRPIFDRFFLGWKGGEKRISHAGISEWKLRFSLF